MGLQGSKLNVHSPRLICLSVNYKQLELRNATGRQSSSFSMHQYILCRPLELKSSSITLNLEFIESRLREHSTCR